jgi:hypothetical protein
MEATSSQTHASSPSELPVNAEVKSASRIGAVKWVSIPHGSSTPEEASRSVDVGSWLTLGIWVLGLHTLFKVFRAEMWTQLKWVAYGLEWASFVQAVLSQPWI